MQQPEVAQSQGPLSSLLRNVNQMASCFRFDLVLDRQCYPSVSLRLLTLKDSLARWGRWRAGRCRPNVSGPKVSMSPAKTLCPSFFLRRKPWPSSESPDFQQGFASCSHHLESLQGLAWSSGSAPLAPNQGPQNCSGLAQLTRKAIYSLHQEDSH